MKKVIVCVIFLFSVSNAYTQDEVSSVSPTPAFTGLSPGTPLWALPEVTSWRFTKTISKNSLLSISGQTLAQPHRLRNPLETSRRNLGQFQGRKGHQHPGSDQAKGPLCH